MLQCLSRNSEIRANEPRSKRQTVMTTQAMLPLASGEALGTPHQSLGSRLGRLGARVRAWFETSADHYEAAVLYDELRGLSDAELRRRGLNKALLAWNLTLACDRTKT
jgi:hypothetical protein